MFQAIITRYLSATDTKPARIKAIAEAGSITLSWDHALNAQENHCAGSLALARKYGWVGCYYGAGAPGNDYVWVCVDISHAKFGKDCFNIMLNVEVAA